MIIFLSLLYDKLLFKIFKLFEKGYIQINTLHL